MYIRWNADGANAALRQTKEFHYFAAVAVGLLEKWRRVTGVNQYAWHVQEDNLVVLTQTADLNTVSYAYSRSLM